MRFLHTADWHLGLSLHGVSMIEDQRHVLNQLIEIVRCEKPDCVVIAGDLYDRANPSAEAVELLSHCLSCLSLELKTPVYLIAGNHDCVTRLDFGSRLFKAHQLHVQAKLTKECLENSFGLGHARFFLLPYANVINSRHCFGDCAITTLQQAMQKAVEQMGRRAENERRILVAHTTIEGGVTSLSERTLGLNFGVDVVSPSVFEKHFDYVALGHLHRAQTISAHGSIVRYAGSILKYSFSEAADRKSVTMVDLGNNGNDPLTYREIFLTPKRDLSVIQGHFADLLANGAHYPNRDHYLCVELLDEVPILDAVSRLREVFAHLLHLKRPVMEMPQKHSSISDHTTPTALSPKDLFAQFYHAVTGQNLTTPQRNALEKVLEDATEKVLEDATA